MSHVSRKTTSAIRTTAPIIETARKASPAIVSPFEVCRRCSLSALRKWSRCQADGAISRAAEIAVVQRIPKKRSRSNWLV